MRVPGWVTASLRVLGGLIWQGTSGEELVVGVRTSRAAGSGVEVL